MREIKLETPEKHAVVDITKLVGEALGLGGDGVVHVTVLHTTAGITTADLDPGTDLDLLDFLDGIVPEVAWRHPHDPAHAPSHLLASLIGPTVSVPVVGGSLKLGTWQRIVLIELDGPRTRHITVAFTPSS